MKVLDLFSGIGGFSLGLERAGMETVAFCEIEPFCQKVLKKHWPDVPIYEDVRSLDYGGTVDVICGGFPCQPFSVAGKQKGEEDDRHLWPAMFSLIKKHRPRWVIGENVGGFINMALSDVLTELEGAGYGVTAFVIPACAINAPHRRDRVWIIANAEKFYGKWNTEEEWGSEREQPRGMGDAMANTTGKRQQRQGKFEQSLCAEKEGKGETDFFESVSIGGEWAAEPKLGRVANGIPDRSHRLKALGNAVVPQIPEIIGRAIMEIEYTLHKSDICV